MDRDNFGYSMKNITVQSQKSYFLQLMEKIEMVIKRMRDKAMHFSDIEDNDNKMEWFGVNMLSSPTPVKKTNSFRKRINFISQEHQI